MKKLYLASKSPSRRYLLSQVRIPFEVIDQSADEQSCDWNLPIEQLVASIAQHKMYHALSPEPSHEGEVIFVLTADTLCQDSQGTIHGKPIDYQDAVSKVKLLRKGARIVTSFCVEKRKAENGSWKVVKHVQKTVVAECVFNIPDDWIVTYFKEQPLALQAAGALAIEEYGLQFLESICGSYSAIIGLPLAELRSVLYELDFFVA